MASLIVIKLNVVEELVHLYLIQRKGKFISLFYNNVMIVWVAIGPCDSPVRASVPARWLDDLDTYFPYCLLFNSQASKGLFLNADEELSPHHFTNPCNKNLTELQYNTY